MAIEVLHRRSLLALLVLTALSACASDPYSEASRTYGIYALEDDDWVRLDGNPDWERRSWADRADLSPDARFIIHEPRLAAETDIQSLQTMIRLEETAHVRNEIDVQTGRKTPVGGSPWAASGYDPFRVPIDFAPVENRPAMISVVPQEPLRPGLYTIRYRLDGTVLAARFGVGWPSIDRDQYAERHCVDRYVGEGRAAYFGCEEGQELIIDGLQIRDLKSSRKTIDGVPVLTVEGAITNTSNAPRRIPALRARIRDQQGVEQQWSFSTERTFVLPAETLNFQNQIQWPMPGADRVSVSFQTAAAPE